MPRDVESLDPENRSIAEAFGVDDYRERVRRGMRALAPHLANLPPEAQAAVVDALKRKASEQQGFGGRVANMVKGALGATAGVMGGIQGVTGIGSTDEATGLPAIKGAPERMDFAENAKRQQEYEDQDVAADSKPFKQNLEEKSSLLWEGLTGLPSALAQAERNNESVGFGEQVGEAVVRDAVHLAASPLETLYRDPTRALDLAPFLKGGGTLGKAVKAGAKAKGWSKVANAAGAVSEFLDPSADASRSVRRSIKDIDTPEADAYRKAEAAALKQEVLDPSEVATDAAKAGSEIPVSDTSLLPEAADLQLSPLERKADMAGRAARGAILVGALGSDSIGALGATAIGAASPLALKGAGFGARKLAQGLAKKRYGVNLNDAEAGAAVSRQFGDPNLQVDPSATKAVDDVAGESIRKRQAIQTAAAPLSEGIRSGEIALGQIDPDNLDASSVQTPITYSHTEWSPERGLSADKAAATASREAFTEAGMAQRTAIAADLQAKAAAGDLRKVKAGVEDEVGKKQLASLYSAKKNELQAIVNDAEASRKLGELEESPAAAAHGDIAEAVREQEPKIAAIKLRDRQNRLARKAAGLEQDAAPIATRVRRLEVDEATLLSDRALVARIEQEAAKAGPESVELFDQTREAVRESIAAQAQLDATMKLATPEARKEMTKMLANLRKAEEKAIKSAAFERLANRSIQEAKAAARAWKKGERPTAKALLGLQLIRREAKATGEKLFKRASPLAALKRSRVRRAWSLGEAARESASRATARKLDTALDAALSDIDKVEAVAAKVDPTELLDLQQMRDYADGIAQGAPRRYRKMATDIVRAERNVQALERKIGQAFANDEPLARIAQMRDELTRLRETSKAMRRQADGKVRAFTKDERRYLAARTRQAEIGSELEGFQAKVQELSGIVGAESAIRAGEARFERGTARADSRKKAGEARSTQRGKLAEDDLLDDVDPVESDALAAAEKAPGVPPLKVRGERTTPRLDPGFINTELGMFAEGISKIVGDIGLESGYVNNILTKSLNQASMIHALNPRVLGWVSARFREALKAAGATDDVIKQTAAFSSHVHRKFDTDKVGTFLRRQIEETVVDQIQSANLLSGPESLVSIALPNGQIFDIGEHVNAAFAELGTKGVEPRELMAQTASIAFDRLATMHMEKQGQRAIVSEALRSSDVVADGLGRMPPPVSQAAAFAKTHASGAPGNIVLFETRPGSEGLQQAFGGTDASIIADAKAKYGIDLTPEQIGAARLDLVNNFMEAPASVREALRKGMEEEGIKIGVDSPVYVRFGYGQSVGTHLDYLAALGQVDNVTTQFMRAIKRGLTVGSTGALVMNAVSNAVLLTVMTGDLDVIGGIKKEGQLLRGFEKNTSAHGVGTVEGRLTEALLGTGIGDSSMAHGFDTSFVGRGSTKGSVRSVWENYWAMRTGAYKQVDSLPKMYLARKQMKQLLADVDDLEPGKVMSMDQGGGNRTLVYRDTAGNLRIDGEIATQKELYRVSAKQATRTSAAALFDFNDTGLFLKSLTKSSTLSVFNELGSWFLKAIELPGRQGILSTAAFFDPSSAYLTNSSKLLKRKTMAFAKLGAKRHALNTSARAVGRYGAESSASRLMGFDGGSTLSFEPNYDDDGRDVTVADMTPSNWMMPALGQAESVAMMAGMAGDLLNDAFGQSDQIKEDKSAVMAASRIGGREFRNYRGLEGNERDRAILIDRMIARDAEILTGKRDLVSSLMDMMQFTGGLLGRSAKADDTTWQKTVAPLVMAAFLGNDGAAIVPLKADPGNDNGGDDPNKFTEGQEDYIRYAFNGLFRFVGREKNSFDAIDKAVSHELGALRKKAKTKFKGMHPDDVELRVDFFSAMINEAGASAREELDKLRGPK